MGFLDIFKDKGQFTVRDSQLPSKIEQLLRKKIPNIKDSDLKKYLKRVKADMEVASGKYSTAFMMGSSNDSPARSKSKGNKWDISKADVYSDMSEDDIIDDFKYYTTPTTAKSALDTITGPTDTVTLEKLQMEETPKSTTKMKKSDLKEMIKTAFIAENYMDDDAALGGMYDDLYEEDLDEMIANLDEEEESLDDILSRISGTSVDPYLAEADKEESAEEILARITGTAVDPYLAEAEGDEEEDVEVDAEEETTDGGEEKNDSIVVDKKIVSLSSLPSETRKILDSLETLRAQAEEFGDQKFITQVGNTITFFTRDFVVAGDEPTRAKVDESLKNKKIMKESLEILKMKKLAGLITEGEYAKALLRENIEQDIATSAKPKIKDLMLEPRTKMIDGVLHIDFDDIGTLWSEVFKEIFKREMDDLIDQDVDDFEKVQNIVMDMVTNNGEIEFKFDY
jgi:hypothetical protein